MGKEIGEILVINCSWCNPPGEHRQLYFEGFTFAERICPDHQLQIVRQHYLPQILRSLANRPDRFANVSSLSDTASQLALEIASALEV